MYRTMTVSKAWKEEIERLIKKKNKNEAQYFILKEVTKFESKNEKSIRIKIPANNYHIVVKKYIEPKHNFSVFIDIDVHTCYLLSLDSKMNLIEISTDLRGAGFIAKVKLVDGVYVVVHLFFSYWIEFDLVDGHLPQYLPGEDEPISTTKEFQKDVNQEISDCDPFNFILLPTNYDSRYIINHKIFDMFDLKTK